MHGPTYVVKIAQTKYTHTNTQTPTQIRVILGKPNKTGGFDQCAFLIVILCFNFVATYHLGKLGE